MFILVFLPFLLATRFSLDRKLYNHGPEYTYHIKISVSDTTNGNADQVMKTLEINSALKCRPKELDSLSCRFEDKNMNFFRTVPTFVKNLNKLPRLYDKPFEIQFDRKGVTGLVVTGDTDLRIIDTIRAIVDQLNIGLDLRFLMDGIYSYEDRSLLGVCPITLKLFHRFPPSWWTDKRFKIVTMRGIRKAEEVALQVEKTRNLKYCTPARSYFFASDSAKSLLEHDGEMTLKSSYSRIVIADTNFTSFTTNEIKVSSTSDKKDYTFSEHITLTLDAITPANTVLPSIPHGTLASFLVRDDQDESRQMESCQDR